MMVIWLKLPKSSQYRRIAGKEDEQVEFENDDRTSLSSASLRSWMNWTVLWFIISNQASRQSSQSSKGLKDNDFYVMLMVEWWLFLIIIILSMYFTILLLSSLVKLLR